MAIMTGLFVWLLLLQPFECHLSMQLQTSQPLKELDAGAVGEGVPHGVQQGLCLGLGRRHHRRVPVPHGRHTEAGGEVHKHVAIDVFDVGSPRPGPDDGVVLGCSEHSSTPGTTRRDGRALAQGQAVHPGAALGSWDVGLEGWEQVTEHASR